jgi:hypothetical protein
VGQHRYVCGKPTDLITHRSELLKDTDHLVANLHIFKAKYIEMKLIIQQRDHFPGSQSVGAGTCLSQPYGTSIMHNIMPLMTTRLSQLPTCHLHWQGLDQCTR